MGKDATCTVSISLQNNNHAPCQLFSYRFRFHPRLNYFLNIYSLTHTYLTPLSDLMIISEVVVTSVCHICDSNESI